MRFGAWKEFLSSQDFEGFLFCKQDYDCGYRSHKAAQTARRGCIRATMREDIRHARSSMILGVLLHALTNRLLMIPHLARFWSLCLGPKQS